MKMEKVQLIFNKELSKINYDVIGSLTDLKLHLIAMEENCDDTTVEGKIIMTNNDPLEFKGDSQSQTLKINNEKIDINTDTDFILNLIFSEYTKYIYSKLNI